MKTFVIGHKKPDTDSVCSAISYAYLKSVKGLKCEPRVLGNLNKETKFVLKYFNIAEPKYLNDVKVKIKNINYLTDAYVDEHVSINDSFNIMQKLNATGLPIVDDDKKVLGYVNLKDICKYLINMDKNGVNASSNPISDVAYHEHPICFKTSDYRDEFIDTVTKYGHSNYPVVDMNNKCVGMLRIIDQNNYERYNVILVDHNDVSQSVDGVSEANILEVIDHHNLGLIGTSSPISFRTIPVGCTSTIINEMYKEANVIIPKPIAGIMLSAILSDTLLLKSPTCTNKDVAAARELADIVGLDIEEYGQLMFKAGTSTEGMDSKAILEQDFKTYKLDDGNIGISQVMTIDVDSILNNKDEYIKLLNDMNKSYNYKVSLMFITDLIKNGSYVLYNDEASDLLESVYNIQEIYQGFYLPNVVSRKKQMLPPLMEYYHKN